MSMLSSVRFIALLLNPIIFIRQTFWGPVNTTARKNLEVQIDPYWVAVKELKLSYHNGYIKSNECAFCNIVT